MKWPMSSPACESWFSMTNPIEYLPGTTLLHRINPVVKLALAASIIIATVLAGSLGAIAGLLCLTLAMGLAVGAAGRLAALLKLLVPLAFIMFVLQTLFVREGDLIWGFFTTGGVYAAACMAAKLLGIALPLALMVMITKVTDLANACVEILHVPYRYAFTFTTALRFVPIFSNEMTAITEAQAARGVEYDTRNPVKKLSLMLPLCVPLLISSVSKTDACALAAEQRGFYLRHRGSAYKRYPITALDAVTLVFCIALIAVGIIL